MKDTKLDPENYGRIRNARGNIAPARACMVIVVGAIVLHFALAGSVRDEQTYSCVGARNAIAMIEQNYEAKYNRYVTGDEEALQDLVQMHLMRALPACRAGGHYSAVANADGSITIHCSNPDHDHGEGVTRPRLRHRF